MTSDQWTVQPHYSPLEARVIIEVLGRRSGATGLRTQSKVLHLLTKRIGEDAEMVIDRLVERFDAACADGLSRSLVCTPAEVDCIDDALRQAYASTPNPTMFYAQFGVDRERVWLMRKALQLDANCARVLADAPTGDVRRAHELIDLGRELRAARGARFVSVHAVREAPELAAFSDALNIAHGRIALSAYQGQVATIRSVFVNDIARAQDRSVSR